MKVKVGKEFKWEMSHRLPFHRGMCKNIHGHSYKMLLQLTGELDDNSMVLDYYEIEKIVSPLIDSLDHAFACNEDDTELLKFIRDHDYKHFMIKGYTTAENLASFFLEEFIPQFRLYKNVDEILIRIYETEDAYAEVSSEF